MKIRVVAVGRVRPPLTDAVAEYEARASRYWKVEWVEVEGGSGGGKPSPDAVRRAEADRILRALPRASRVILLTREGKGMSSRDLARVLDEGAVYGKGDVTFVIGGAYGVAPEVSRRASATLSLSPMTLPHEMARLILAEQLYRAGTILRNEPYHKGA
ncbi:MAG: 23S rRNA (pseudouridine(1915)-N(3))-methyltransferase RlmH [Gemmatimonadota bacterium]